MDEGGVALLRTARGFVRRGWTQHADARDVAGCVVAAWSEDAVAWSLLGALVASYETQSGGGEMLAMRNLSVACHRLADLIEVDSLVAWNDVSGRTRAQVLHVLRQAADAIVSERQLELISLN